MPLPFLVLPSIEKLANITVKIKLCVFECIQFMPLPFFVLPSIEMTANMMEYV